MKPTLNEEIRMSKKGIEYVNSLEVKEPKLEAPVFNVSYGVAMKAIKNDLPTVEEMERQRIKRQGRNALICVLIIIALTFITNYFNK